MIVGICEAKLRIPMSQSLKDKRNIIKGTLKRLKNQFNVAAAEVSQNEIHKLSTVGIVTVGNGYNHVEQQLEKVIEFIEDNYDLQLVDYTLRYD